MGSAACLARTGTDWQRIAHLIALFDQLVEDDWAQDELPEVMGMIGQSAITPLNFYLNESHHDEFARAMAANALAEIVKRDPSCREQVIQCYQEYMSHPDESASTLNGLLVCCLLDLDAKETINDIRRLFEKGCVDITCAGDIEEIEIELGFRTERSTPEPGFAQQQLIEPNVLRLFQHFFEQRTPVTQTVVSGLPKVGRNDPCPCGSGIKFKKCCLH